MNGKRIINVLFCMCLLLFYLYPNLVQAHSGGTDASGGHTCRTNCEHYGLEDGEYHYHNNGDSQQDDYDKGYNEGYQTAFSYASKCEGYEWSWEGTQAYDKGFEDGVKAGEEAGEVECQAIPVENDNTTQIYEEESFMDTYERIRKETERQDAIYDQGREDGYDLGKLKNINAMPSEDREIYLNGYKEGIVTLSIEAKKDGYEEAFSTLESDVDVPNRYSESFDGYGVSDSEYFNGMDEDEQHEAEKELGIDMYESFSAFMMDLIQIK